MQTSRRAFLSSTVALGALAVSRRSGASHADSTIHQASPTARGVPTPEEFHASLRARRNWGRWGADDEIGAVNLITPEKRRAAAGLVRSGRTVSLSRPFNPAQQFVRADPQEGQRGAAMDYLGFIFHGYSSTHIDGLSHMWGEDGMWNGRNPGDMVKSNGAKFGQVDAWKDGIVTKGVLLDVPRHRGTPHVTLDTPIHGWELEQIASAQGVSVEAGDALLVYSGRETWERGGGNLARAPRPGLHPSCADYVRDHDVALLGWDMMDATAPEYGRNAMHGVLFNYGVPLLDNASFEALSAACAEEDRYEVMFMALPLRIEGGTGSPANPVAML